MSADPHAPISVNVSWPFEQTSFPQFVNQFAVLDGPGLADGTHDGTAYLLVGNFVPPLVQGEGDLKHVIDSTGGTLPINIVGTFAVPVARLRELHKVIGNHLEMVDRRSGSAER